MTYRGAPNQIARLCALHVLTLFDFLRNKEYSGRGAVRVTRHRKIGFPQLKGGLTQFPPSSLQNLDSGTKAHNKSLSNVPADLSLDANYKAVPFFVSRLHYWHLCDPKNPEEDSRHTVDLKLHSCDIQLHYLDVARLSITEIMKKTIINTKQKLNLSKKGKEVNFRILNIYMKDIPTSSTNIRDSLS